jgi:hypothetical protein
VCGFCVEAECVWCVLKVVFSEMGVERILSVAGRDSVDYVSSTTFFLVRDFIKSETFHIYKM